MTIINRYAYCEPLADILDFQYHMLVYIADKYNGGSKPILLVRSIDTVQTCVTCNSLCVRCLMLEIVMFCCVSLE